MSRDSFFMVEVEFPTVVRLSIPLCDGWYREFGGSCDCPEYHDVVPCQPEWTCENYSFRSAQEAAGFLARTKQEFVKLTHERQIDREFRIRLLCKDAAFGQFGREPQPPTARPSTVSQWRREVLTLVSELKDIGKLHEARMSPPTIAMIAEKLKRLMADEVSP